MQTDVSVAYIIRDSRRRVVQAGGKKLLPSSVSFAEMAAVWLGMRAALLDINATHLQVELTISLKLLILTL